MHRLLSRSERNGINVHRSSSETTVFDFRSSDSEDESHVADVHSLNDMRKDRKTRTPPSGTVTPPTVIDQLNDVSFYQFFSPFRIFLYFFFARLLIHRISTIASLDNPDGDRTKGFLRPNSETLPIALSPPFSDSLSYLSVALRSRV